MRSPSEFIVREGGYNLGMRNLTWGCLRSLEGAAKKEDLGLVDYNMLLKAAEKSTVKYIKMLPTGKRDQAEN